MSKIKIGSETFFAKKGYHCSLLCLETLSIPAQEKVLKFAQNYPIKLKKLTNVYRLVTLGNRKSIIVRVRLAGLKRLIYAVNKHFGYDFLYPPTHVTLFTLKGQFGIPVNSNNEYRVLSRGIGQKYSQQLAQSFKLI